MKSSGPATRTHLADLLTEAAELEHSLVCQYLFAAFSLKRTHAEGGVSWAQLELMRQWETSVMLVARQEMEHLGLVSNLLTAIGEPPHLVRPDFPLGPRHYDLSIPCRLEVFGRAALLRFICFEMPSTLTPEERADLERVGAGLDAARHQTIGGLYHEIRALFVSLDGPGLFVGPPSAQLTTNQLQYTPLRGVGTPGQPLYQVELIAVTGLESAVAVIDKIIEEGEGTESGAPGPSGRPSHFQRFCEIAIELEEQLLADPGFAPARPVVDDLGGVTNPATRELMALFDGVYRTMLLLIIRFFGRSGETFGELAAIEHVAFFPLMTTVIRPLGELLTAAPAHARGDATAGPAFRLPRSIGMLPGKRPAWLVLREQLAELADEATRLAGSESYPGADRARLALMGENLGRLAGDFARAMGVPAG